MGQVIWVFAQPVSVSQVSVVQAFPSSQLIGAFTHLPVTGSHESAVHRLLSLHDGGALCWHRPLTHVSAVQALLSLQSFSFVAVGPQPPNVTPSQLLRRH